MLISRLNRQSNVVIGRYAELIAEGDILLAKNKSKIALRSLVNKHALIDSRRGSIEIYTADLDNEIDASYETGVMVMNLAMLVSLDQQEIFL